MRLLRALYEKVATWVVDPKATRYLAWISFIDASVFPLSPNFLLIPMSLVNRNKTFYFTSIVIVFSLLGGILGYGLGYFVFEEVLSPFIEWMGSRSSYDAAIAWSERWGFWAIILGCLTPFIPYKVFTISSGLLQLHFGHFMLAALIGRSLRFILIASVLYWGGPMMQPILLRLQKSIKAHN